MGISGLVQPQVFQNLVDDLGLLNACNDFHSGGAPLAATLLAFLNIYLEYTFQPLRPGHAAATRFVCGFIFGFRWHHFFSQFAIRREYTVKSRQIHPGLGYQCSQPTHELHRAEDDVSCAIVIWIFELVDNVSI